MKKLKIGLYLFVCISILMLATLNFVIGFFQEHKPRVLGTEDFTQRKIDFWQNFLVIYPTYEAGWIEIAKIEIQKQNYTEALWALSKAKEINPNSEKVKNLESELQK